MKINLKKEEFLYLCLLFFLGIFLRLYPRLGIDSRLLTFEADIWYRLTLAQNLLDTGKFPASDIRYLAYGYVPTWYNPLGIYILAFLSKISSLDLPAVSSRVMPFIEALSFIPMYFLCRSLFNRRVAVLSTLFLSLTPSFVFWTGISSPQSFNIFLIPIMILLWLRFLRSNFLFSNKWLHLFFMGLLLGISFLIHLTYFTLLIVILSAHLALVLESRARLRDMLYFFIAILVSQALTAWWWLPKNLYWWWVKGLTTSSGYYGGRLFLEHFGRMSAILGHLAFFILLIYIFKNHKSFPRYYLIPILWAIFPMFESHNEGFLRLVKHPELSWSNLAKPLEGFRFYCFLAQPLAVCFALVMDRFFKKWLIPVMFFISFALFLDIFKGYKLFERFRNPCMQIEEIQAAEWYRENSNPTDRILTEYFTAQMFAGINGGKALLGSLFPLKNVDIPYINEDRFVQKDIYSVYSTDEPDSIGRVLERYGCTDVFYSKKALSHIEFITKGDTALDDIEGLREKDYSATLFNPRYFKPIFENKDVKILKWIEK